MTYVRTTGRRDSFQPIILTHLHLISGHKSNVELLRRFILTADDLAWFGCRCRKGISYPKADPQDQQPDHENCRVASYPAHAVFHHYNKRVVEGYRWELMLLSTSAIVVCLSEGRNETFERRCARQSVRHHMIFDCFDWKKPRPRALDQSKPFMANMVESQNRWQHCPSLQRRGRRRKTTGGGQWTQKLPVALLVGSSTLTVSETWVDIQEQEVSRLDLS